MPPTCVGRRQDHRGDDRLLDLLDAAGVGQLRRAVDLLHHAVGRRHAVENARRGRDQVHVELALEPLLDDLHVEQAEEAAAEAEAERRRRLRLEDGTTRRSAAASRARRAARGYSLPSTGYSPAKTIGFISLKPGNGSGVGRAASVIVSPICASLTVLMPAKMKPTSPTPSSSTGIGLGENDADLLDLVLLPLRHEPDLHAGADRRRRSRGSG